MEPEVSERKGQPSGSSFSFKIPILKVYFFSTYIHTTQPSTDVCHGSSYFLSFNDPWCLKEKMADPANIPCISLWPTMKSQSSFMDNSHIHRILPNSGICVSLLNGFPWPQQCALHMGVASACRAAHTERWELGDQYPTCLPYSETMLNVFYTISQMVPSSEHYPTVISHT